MSSPSFLGARPSVAFVIAPAPPAHLNEALHELGPTSATIDHDDLNLGEPLASHVQSKLRYFR